MLKKLSIKTNFILIGIVVGLFVGVSIRQVFGQGETNGTARADNLTVNMSANAENGLIVANGNLLVPNGNIGIGTTTPTTSLDVVGDIKTTGSIKSNNLCIGATCINENQLQALLAVGGTGTDGTGGTVTPGTGIGTTLGTNNGGVVSGGDSDGNVDILKTTKICNGDMSNPSDTICNDLSNSWMDTTFNLQNARRGGPKIYLFVDGVFILANGLPIDRESIITNGTVVPIQWGSNNATSCTLDGVSVPTSGAKTLTVVGNIRMVLKCTNSTGYAILGIDILYGDVVVSGGDGETERPDTSFIYLDSPVAVNSPFTISFSGRRGRYYHLYVSGSFRKTVSDSSWTGTPASLGLSATTYVIGVRACNSKGCGPLVTKNLKVTAPIVIPIVPIISSMSIIGKEAIVVNGTNLEEVTGLSYTVPSPNAKITPPVTYTYNLAQRDSKSPTQLVLKFAQPLGGLENSRWPIKAFLVSPTGKSAVFTWEKAP